MEDIQCESKKITPPYDFCQFLPNGYEFSIEILHTYYAFKYTIDCQILSNYLQTFRLAKIDKSLRGVIF